MKKINKILLVSDSHGDLNNFERILKLEKPDYVIHAGDYDNWGLGKGKDVIIPKNYIKKNFNQSILGNHGCSIISKSHPEFIEKYKNDYKIFNLLGKKVMLTHSFELLDESHRKNYGEWLDFFNSIKPLRDMQVKKEKIDIVICGHTHMPKIIKTKNLTMINPGSTYKSRDPRGQSYAIANVDKGEITFKIKYLK